MDKAGQGLICWSYLGLPAPLYPTPTSICSQWNRGFGTALELRAWPQVQICTAAMNRQPRTKAGKEREETAWMRATR